MDKLYIGYIDYIESTFRYSSIQLIIVLISIIRIFIHENSTFLLIYFLNMKSLLLNIWKQYYFIIVIYNL